MWGASATDLVEHDSGDVVMVGDIPIELIHTPGHTPEHLAFVLAQGPDRAPRGPRRATCPRQAMRIVDGVLTRENA